MLKQTILFIFLIFSIHTQNLVEEQVEDYSDVDLASLTSF